MKNSVKLVFILSCVIISGMSCISHDSKCKSALPLTPPPPPFKEKKTFVNIKTFNPKIRRNTIIFGNKELKINDDGSLGIYADSVRLAKLYYYFNTDSYDWIPIYSRKHFKKLSFKMDTKRGVYEYTGEFSLQKSKNVNICMGHYFQKVELLKDGRIKVDINWNVPEGMEKCVKSDGYFITFSGLDLKGTKVIVNGKDYSVPKDRKWGFFTARGYCMITVFPGNKRKMFTIEPKIFRLALGASSEKDVHVRLWPVKKDKHLSFVINMKTGAKRNATADFYAGIDFRKIENLEMPDFHSSKNLIRNPSFEQGLKAYRISGCYVGHEIDERKWKNFPYVEDKTERKFGFSSLKIKTFYKTRKYDYRGQWKPGNITTLPVPIEAGTYTFSFYAKGNRAPSQTLSVWCPNAAWCGNIYLPIHDANKVIRVSNEWKRYSMTFNVPKSMPFQVNFNAVSETGDGSVWIDGLQLERGERATEFETRPIEGRFITSMPGNFLSTKDKIDARLMVFTKSNIHGKIKVSVKNFFGEKLFDEKYYFKSNVMGKSEIKLPFDNIFSPGIYVVKAEYELETGEKTHDFFRFSIMDFLENKHPLKNIFADQYGCYAENPNFLKILERWKKIGIGAKNHMYADKKKIWDIYKNFGVKVTDYFTMRCKSVRNHKKGTGTKNERLLYYQLVSNPPNHQPVFNVSRDSILIDDYRKTNKNATLTKAYIEHFENAVAMVVKRHPWINMWAMMGEMGAKWPDWAGLPASDEEFDKYVRLQIAFYKGVKKGNPNAKVFNGDPANMRPEHGIRLLDRLLTAIHGKIKYDMIGIHPYRATPEDPDLDSDTATLLKVLEKHGYKNTPVFFPEGMHWGPYNIPQWGIVSANWGAPKCWYYGALSYDMGWTEKISAAWRARSWLVALKYQHRIKSFMSAAFVNNFAIDMDLTPFATQKISNTLGNLLGDSHFKKDIRFAPYTRCYIFEDTKERPVAVVWCYHPQVDSGKIAPPLAKANFSNQQIEIFDLMQTRRIPRKDKFGNIIFPLSSFPLFFRGKPGTFPEMSRSFDNADLIESKAFLPLSIAVKPISAAKAVIQVQNMLSKKFNGTFLINKNLTHVTVEPSKSKNIIFDLPFNLKDDKIVKENIEVTIKSETSKICKFFSFNCFICHKISQDINIDGKLDDWKNIHLINFRNRLIMDKARKKISDNDFSGRFGIGWNEKGIYLCAEIKDDKFVHKEFSKTGRRWCNDCLQIYFDTLCDAHQNETHGYDRNDYDYAVFPDPKGVESVVYRYHSPDPQLTLGTAAPKNNSIEKNIKSAFRKTSFGYVYEIFFPAKYLLPIRLEKGYTVGFGLYADDCDDPTLQYPKRVESALTLAPNGKECYNNPRLWPIMLLWE